MLLGLSLIFGLIAALYAAAGLGGGSSYLAAMALLNLPRHTIVPIALACNLIAAGTSCYHYYRAGHFRGRLLLPFAIGSIPAAYLGSRLTVSDPVFKMLLGVTLFGVALRLLVVPQPHSGGEGGTQQALPVGGALLAPVIVKTPDALSDAVTISSSSRPMPWRLGVPIGIGLGLLAGLVGIGGGIFLIPTLLLLRWAGPKQAAATGAAFIVLNSFAGLGGYLQQGATSLALLLPLAGMVVVGSQIGARMGARRWSPRLVQQCVSIIVMVAAVRVLWSFL